jgi:hypothetical protein
MSESKCGGEPDLDAYLPPLNMIDNRIPCPNCGHQADRGEGPDTWECPNCRFVWNHKETWLIEGKPHVVQSEDCMGNPEGPYFRVYGNREGRSYSGHGLTAEQALDDLRKKMAIGPAVPVGEPLLPEGFDPEKCYRQHPGFQQLTDYLQGLVLSGAFATHEITGSAMLAGKRAEAERKGIPSHPATAVQPTTPVLPANPLDALERHIERERGYQRYTRGRKDLLGKVLKWIGEARKGELP